MSQVKVIGIADLRGKKKKDGTEMNFAVFHCMFPLRSYPGNYGYECKQIFVPSNCLNGVKLEAPASYDLEKDFATDQVIKCQLIGKD